MHYPMAYESLNQRTHSINIIFNTLNFFEIASLKDSYIYHNTFSFRFQNHDTIFSLDIYLHMLENIVIHAK